MQKTLGAKMRMSMSICRSTHTQRTPIMMVIEDAMDYDKHDAMTILIVINSTEDETLATLRESTVTRRQMLVLIPGLLGPPSQTRHRS